MVISLQVLALPHTTFLFVCFPLFSPKGWHLFLKARWVTWGTQTAHGKLRNESVTTSIPIPCLHSSCTPTLLAHSFPRQQSGLMQSAQHVQEDDFARYCPNNLLLEFWLAQLFCPYMQSCPVLTHSESFYKDHLTHCLNHNSLLNTLKLFLSLLTYS